MMKNCGEKTFHLGTRPHAFVVAILLTGLLASCVPSGESGGNRRSGTTSNVVDDDNDSTIPTNTNPEPEFGTSINFFQQGSSSQISLISLENTFKDSFYMRGSEISIYLKAGNNLTNHCLIANFPDPSGADNADRVLVINAAAKSFFNFTDQTQEFYYILNPSNQSSNSSVCSSLGVSTTINSSYPEANTIAYSLDTLCPNCPYSELNSSAVKLVTADGNAVEDVGTSYLTMRVKNTVTSNTETGTSCTSSSECVSKGFDCCTLGQCVNDQTLKPNVNQSDSEFIQAQIDIAVSPANIFNYPQFYFLCGSNEELEPTPVATINIDAVAADRITRLRELYECTTPVEGEMSLCTVTYENATTSARTEFPTGNDDRTFEDTYSGTANLPEQSIVDIFHAGRYLYQNRVEKVADSFSINSTIAGQINDGNDNFTDPTVVRLFTSKPSGADNDTLKIRYQIDGSCRPINSLLAKCQKWYVQGQNDGKITDHYPGSNNFALPLYADTSRLISVEVDGYRQIGGTDWTMIPGAPAYIQFIGDGLQIFDNQVVTLEFFVSTVANDLFQELQNARDEIDNICNCGGEDCYLAEVETLQNGIPTVTDYECRYVDDNPTPALQVSKIMSAKSVPWRYFDLQGLEYTQEEVDSFTPAQEGTHFKYTDNNLLKPNNVDQYVGFHEIYGTQSYVTTSSKPPLKVDVEVGKSYDIFVDYGTFSTCFFCGNDYWANVAKLFPVSFSANGGGYRPNATQTNERTANDYRKDDLLFGRACWLPATMIPWSHRPNSSRNSQRRDREAAQHFLFANGYQRDWYGFDYGSVIGSFDGVTWFSVGNQRRITAKTTKLFLAINAYFGDLTQDNSYQITVSQSSIVLGAGATVTADENSDGAECRQYHLCESDQDCVSQLGWEYMCEKIDTLRSDWPRVDNNGTEIPDTEQEATLLKNLFFTNDTGKRCVYRGRGAPCHVNYDNLEDTATYARVGTDTSSDVNSVTTGETGLLTCAPNYYCQKIVEGIKARKFNNRISRYGRSIANQNASTTIVEDDLDTFGLGARIIGRPHDYQGDEAIASGSAQANLSNNFVDALCIPGRGPHFDTNTTFKEIATSPPEQVAGVGDDFSGDQMLGQGMTMSGDDADANYLNACGIFNDDGDYYFRKRPNFDFSEDLTVDVDDATSGLEFKYIAASQVTSTNALRLFEDDDIAGETLVTDYFDFQNTEPIYQKNRCLRMPGSVCFSDADCVANKAITDKTNLADPEANTFDGVRNVNSFELRFWQETLVCGQAEAKDSPDYDPKLNRCCREVGLETTVPNLIDVSGFADADLTTETPRVVNDITNGMHPVDFEINDGDSLQRNTQMGTYIKEGIANPTNYPTVLAPVADQCGGADVSELECTQIEQLKRQFNTIATAASKTCCSGHWVRNFADGNGGGHLWTADKFQPIDVTVFACRNWMACTSGNCISPDGGFDCSHEADDPSSSNCLLRTISEEEADSTSDAFARFDLMGIPQVPMLYPSEESPDSSAGDYLRCLVDPENQAYYLGNDFGDGPPTGEAPNDGNNFDPNWLPGLWSDNLAREDDGNSFTEDEGKNAEIFWDEDVPENSKGQPMTSAKFGLLSTDEGNFDDEGPLKQIFSEDTFTCCKPAGAQLATNESAENCCTGTASSSTRKCVLQDYTNVSVYFNKYVSSIVNNADTALLGDEIFDERTGYVKDPEILKGLACALEVCNSGVLATGVVYGTYLYPGSSTIQRTPRFLDRSPDSDLLDGYFNIGVRWKNSVYCVPADVPSQASQAQIDNMGIHICP